jgi:mono/diheme cytochrome c family protein
MLGTKREGKNLVLVAIAAGCLSGPAAAVEKPAAKIIVEGWVRPAGNADATEASTGARVGIDLASLPVTRGRRFDAQLDKYLWFEGVPVATVIAQLKPADAVDLALLHFSNGMTVPLPFRDKRVMDQLDPFIALGARAVADGPYRAELPPLVRKGSAFADAPAIHFSGNKVVVARLWHPAVGDAIQADFSPWAFVDSLVGVELVEAAPYYRQFDVDSKPEARTGLALFQQSCQFCHGARKVGAKFGWDFVEPTPLYSYRKGGTRLYYHVHFRRYDAVQRGQNMPALKSMTKGDAENLWQWLAAIGTRPMPPYTPGH